MLRPQRTLSDNTNITMDVHEQQRSIIVHKAADKKVTNVWPSEMQYF